MLTVYTVTLSSARSSPPPRRVSQEVYWQRVYNELSKDIRRSKLLSSWQCHYSCEVRVPCSLRGPIGSLIFHLVMDDDLRSLLDTPLHLKSRDPIGTETSTSDVQSCVLDLIDSSYFFLTLSQPISVHSTRLDSSEHFTFFVEAPSSLFLTLPRSRHPSCPNLQMRKVGLPLLSERCHAYGTQYRD